MLVKYKRFGNNGMTVDPNASSGDANGTNVLSSVLTGAQVGPIGAAVGLVGGTIASLIAAGKNAKIKRKQEAAARMAEDQQQSAYNDAVYSAYDATGLEGNTYFYKAGGKYKMPTRSNVPAKMVPGGAIVPISQRTEIAIGKSHESGGIHPQPNVEVEGGEVSHKNTDGSTTWFSTQLKDDAGMTFAERALKVAKNSGKDTIVARFATGLDKATAKRNLENADRKLQMLSNEQEQKQIKSGYPTNGVYAAKGTVLDTLSTLVPFADNAVNALLTGSTPEVPKPRLAKAVPLDTTINVGPQIEAIRQSEAAAYDTIKSSTNRGSVVRSAAIASRLSSIGAQNQVFGQKENQEAQLRNEDALNRQGVYNANQQVLANHDTNVYNRDLLVQSRISENVSNLVDDFNNMDNIRRMKERDNTVLDLMKERFKNNGIWDRTVSDAFEQYMKGQIGYEEFARQMNDNINNYSQPKPENFPTAGETYGKITPFNPLKKQYTPVFQRPIIRR